jgi:hypothetical protein
MKRGRRGCKVTKKVIAVQYGLTNITDKLKYKGYHVTSLNGTERAIDVMVYSGILENVSAKETPNLTLPSNNRFVMMLNADEYDEDELIHRID